MKKLVGFIVATGILVAMGAYFMNNGGQWAKDVVDWSVTEMTTEEGGDLSLED